jgi:hypothetical protein
MAEPWTPKVFTLQEADQLLPQVASQVAELKALRQSIVGLQARVDIEELAGGPPSAAEDAVGLLLGQIDAQVRQFHARRESLHALGCELKDLARGLVDFLAERDGRMVYLCWMEGEERIAHWHDLDEGFAGRRPL